MNKAKLKTFAIALRAELMDMVTIRLDYLLAQDILHLPPELFDHKSKLEQIISLVDRDSKTALVEKVSYIWFNRFVAMRFMDANGINEIRIVSPLDGHTLPQLFSEAKSSNIPSELKLDRQKFFDLIDGKINASDPQNEAYSMLFIAACNSWHSAMPFLFEQIADYTEILLPSDMLGPNSIRAKIVEALGSEECEDVEVIGWLYQFYITERKDAAMSKKSKYDTSEIPAVTQLFTPHWIVRYLVENSLGRIWLASRPNSRLKEKMPYFIEHEDATEPIKVKSAEDLTLCDPCCGSGHMLTYAFDLLTHIYEEEGYAKSEIPSLILTHNLYGCDIDERAAELAAFALTMKARLYHKRFFNKSVLPNIVELMPYGDDRFAHIKDVGSLIKVGKKADKGSGVFAHSNREFDLQEKILSEQFCCVVTNPPYMGNKGMTTVMGEYVKKNYPDSKADLFACFIERAIDMTVKNGFSAAVTMHSWMFLSSYEALRVKILENHKIDTLVHLGTRAFEEIGGEVVQTVAFVLQRGD